ncbi:hypothetical protein PMAYCL1PPCAC_14584, partial [Pristionchus mayeri]
ALAHRRLDDLVCVADSARAQHSNRCADCSPLILGLALHPLALGQLILAAVRNREIDVSFYVVCPLIAIDPVSIWSVIKYVARLLRLFGKVRILLFFFFIL